MKFVFCDKSKVEMEIITDVLHEENIPYKIKSKIIKDMFFDDDDEPDFMIVEELYDIECFTTLEYFDFVKHIAYKRIDNRIKLERDYISKMKVGKKHVQRVSKKNTTDTNNKDRGKQ